jgi:UDP-3-O-[3-hydroxymyristoyl] glucosamine N-acyltransferase
MSLSLGELAVRFGCELRGDPSILIERVATLSGATPGALAFLANPQYRRQLEATRASVVVLTAADAAQCSVPALIHPDPYATFARIAALLYPEPAVAAGIHESAIIDPTAYVDASASIGALVVIGAQARIGARALIGPGSILGEGVTVGADTRLTARVTLLRRVVLGERCIVHPGAVIGADGFGFARERSGFTKVPQVGAVHIADDVEIGANTTIDRGAIEDTQIEQGVKLDNQIQIGHNVRVGAHTVIAGCTGVSGSTRIGQRCMIGGASAIAGHLEICDDAVITGSTNVTRSITKPDMYSSTLSAEPARLWRRLAARFKRLDRDAARLTRLERAVGMAGQTAVEQEPNDE